MHLTYFDFAVLTILGLSAILSFYRGLVREMLSLGAWVGALIVSLYTFKPVANLLKSSVGNDTIAGAFAALATFLIALIAISIIGRVILKFVKSGADIGLLDHGMGLMFGLARGALVIAIGYYIFSFAVPNEKDAPEWMQESVTRPYVKRAAFIVGKLAPSYVEDITGKKPASFVDDTKERGKSLLKEKLPEEDLESDLRDAAAAHADETKKPMVDWPTQDDLKQRLDEAAKGK